MNVGDLIALLQTCPKDLDVRVTIPTMEEEGWTENFWVDSLNVYPKGSSGYEDDGEVVIGGAE